MSAEVDTDTDALWRTYNASLMRHDDLPAPTSLRWLIAIRLIAITSALVPIVLLNLGAEETLGEPRFMLQWGGAAYVASVFYLVMLQVQRPSSRIQAYIQFFGDLLLITSLIEHLGATSGPLSILYLIVITVASVMLRRRAGVAVATAAWIFYATVLVALFFGWGRDGAASLTSLPLSRLAYDATAHLFGFYAIALLTSSLALTVTRAEEALLEKRADLADLRVAHRDVIGSIPSGIVTTDSEGRITSANEAAQEILGQPEALLLSRMPGDLGLIDREQWSVLVREALEGDRQREEAEYELNGAVLTIGYAVTPLTRADGSGAGFILIFQDLTEWRKLQDQVRLGDRMAAVGEMASGLAHEVGNPLAAISGSVQMLTSSFSQESSQRKLLEIIAKESQRLDRTIKGFLQFARPKARASVRFDVTALLAENVELLRNSEEVALGHAIELDLDPPTAYLVADPDQISQIFWNLVRNSLRAMESQGTLRVVGRVVKDTYRMRFIDTGRGMTEDERANIFHPFRSFFDGGTGIGMAIVYRIVEEHQGKLWVESQPGSGTQITVEIPGVQAERDSLTAEA
ncbi:MAG: ATP-binding protein [Acidobacteriota bacterium]|nr:ATP-binding protein [Acidobacteriota bacterium]